MRLTIAPVALDELHNATAFYTARADAPLGQAFAAEFERVTSLLLNNPKLGRVFRSNKRRFVMRRFPYNVIYQIALDELRIIAVAHQSRRPGYWAKRKET